jgi:hypothetical protein
VDEPNDARPPANRLTIVPVEPGTDPRVPDHACAAAAAYVAEIDDLLARLATHPDEQWVAYRWRERVGFGTDHLRLLNECLAKFPDGEFSVYYIDPCIKYPDDIVV